MIWLFIVLVYILPIIFFYTIAYIRMESKQTISSYLCQHDLDDIEIWMWIPVFNLVFSIAFLIHWFTSFIGEIKKP